MPMAHHHSYSNQSLFDKRPRLGHWTLCSLFQTIHWIRSKPWSTFSCTACALCSALLAGLTSLLCLHSDFIFFPLPGLWDHRVYNNRALLLLAKTSSVENSCRLFCVQAVLIKLQSLTVRKKNMLLSTKRKQEVSLSQSFLMRTAVFWTLPGHIYLFFNIR